MSETQLPDADSPEMGRLVDWWLSSLRNQEYCSEVKSGILMAKGHENTGQFTYELYHGRHFRCFLHVGIVGVQGLVRRGFGR